MALIHKELSNKFVHLTMTSQHDNETQLKSKHVKALKMLWTQLDLVMDELVNTMHKLTRVGSHVKALQAEVNELKAKWYPTNAYAYAT